MPAEGTLFAEPGAYVGCFPIGTTCKAWRTLINMPSLSILFERHAMEMCAVDAMKRCRSRQAPGDGNALAIESPVASQLELSRCMHALPHNGRYSMP